MATIQKFEDLLVWQRSRELVKEIYKTFRSCRDDGFRDQIERAAVSILSNIAEGFERGTRQEFLNYLFIAKGSAGEVRAQLYAALDIGYVNMETFKYLSNLATQCSRLLASFIEKVKSGSRSGMQFKPKKCDDGFEKMLQAHDLVRLENGQIISKDKAHSFNL